MSRIDPDGTTLGEDMLAGFDWIRTLWRRLRQGRLLLILERKRLEAFLNAAPQPFCGWNQEGVIAVSPQFLKGLGIESVDTPDDLTHAFLPADGQQLREVFRLLQEKGTSFDRTLSLADGRRHVSLSGRRGTDLSGQEIFDVLWLSDVTDSLIARRDEEKTVDGLRQERQRLQMALENLGQPVWLRDADAKLVWGNAAYRALFADNGATLAELVPGGSILARQALAAAGSQQVSRHRVIQGSRRLLQITEIPLGPDEGTVGMALDQTGIEELRSELARHIASHGKVLEALGSAIAIFGSDSRIQFYNAAFVDLMRLEEAWLAKKPTLGEVLEALREVRRLPETANFPIYKRQQLDMFTGLIEAKEDLLHLPDGTTLRRVIAPHPMGGLLFNMEDVTSRLALETSYNTLMAVQRETLNNLAEGVIVVGGDGRIRLWNPAYARIWRLEEAALAGAPHITDLIESMRVFYDQGGNWESLRDELLANALDRTARTGRLRRGDGTVIEYATVPLPDGAVLNSFLDVSDSVRVEHALRERNAALEAADRLKSEFLANVSYQLRTPLNAIMGFAEILEQKYFGPLNDKQGDHVESILEAGRGLLALIDDILDLATIEAGYMVLDRKAVDLSRLLQTVYDRTRDWAGKQSLHLVLQAEPDLGAAMLDETRIKQALISLISNAIKYSLPGGRIEISAMRRGDSIELTVADTGVGIPEEDQQRVFDSFVRANPQMRQDGVGLGLSLVNRFVELHGGRIELESRAGSGTRISLILPVEDAQQPQAA